MIKKLENYKERNLAEKIKKLEKEKESYLDYKNLNKTFFIRCDGRSFKTFTKGFKKPFDTIFRETMERTMVDICSEVQGACLGFTQSDEITIMFKKEDESSDVFFGGRIIKIVSEVSSLATLNFNKNLINVVEENKENLTKEDYEMYKNKFLKATFDARVFEIEKENELEPIIWRVLDCYKNAVQMIARTYYSHKQLNNKNLKDMENMLLEKNIKISSFESRNIYGKFCVKEPVVLYEGTERECTRKKWMLKNIEDIVYK